MPSSITHVPPNEDSALQNHYLIFFITGNPGLIGYYTTFCSTLNQLLSTPNKSYSANFTIYGQSLPGFEDEPQLQDGPYGLKQVITITYDALVKQRISSGSREGKPFDGVVLIGHSVGSYIALEILREIAACQSGEDQVKKIKIIEAILLFPAVTHIAQSPSGVKAAALFKIPDFPRRAHSLAGWLLWMFPYSVLSWLVGAVMRMPPDASAITTTWLRSGKGIWQALHMARDEMEIITGDKWDEEIWGVEDQDPYLEGRPRVPKLVFYFGQQDHWVADHTRDALIASRAGKGAADQSSRPEMIIDHDGIPHGFCLRHSEVVAEKVKKWIDDAVEIDSKS